MVIQRLEMCMELLKMAIEFVIVVAEAVGMVIQENMSPNSSAQRFRSHHIPSVPFVGFFP